MLVCTVLNSVFDLSLDAIRNDYLLTYQRYSHTQKPRRT